MNAWAIAKSGKALAILLLAGACSNVLPFTKIDGTDPAALAKLDRRWVVLNTGGTDVQAMDPPATMVFDTAAGTVSGFDGCNEFDGTFTFEQGRLEADVSSTDQACTSDTASDVSSTINDLFTQGAEVVDTEFMAAEVLMLTNDSGDVRMAPPEMLSEK